MRSRIFAFAFLCLALTGCGGEAVKETSPMMGLTWFEAYDDVKAALSDYELLKERESTEQQAAQRMQDYTGASLFDLACDLTLCFTDAGLIGFNYHDVEKQQTYRGWFSKLEDAYGLPTEQGSGMASWYDDPLGKNTAVYLFNLREGVQVSFYATADSPDQSYEKQKKSVIPTPELRTPVVPDPDPPVSAPETASAEPERTTTAASAHQVRREPVIGTNADGDTVVIVTDTAGEHVTDPAGVTVTTVLTETTEIGALTAATDSTAVSAAEPAETGLTDTASAAETVTQPADHRQDFLLNGLEFYGSPDAERQKMRQYTQLYEYRTEEAGQPWELIMEYSRVRYLGKRCDAVLCFTSLGLVGITYFDTNVRNFSYWTEQLTSIYGLPDAVQSDYAVWNTGPVGEGTVIYVFLLEDGVQISFFADDTGSELSS